MVSLTTMVEEHAVPSDGVASKELLSAVQNGDGAAFSALVRRHHRCLMCLSRLYLSTDAEAADAVKRTWVEVLSRLDDVAADTMLRPWMFRLLVGEIRKHGSGNALRAPFASTTRVVDDPYDGAISPERLKPSSDPEEPLHWATPPPSWNTDSQLDGGNAELRSILEGALEALSPAQQEVITLRDLLGWKSNEVADALAITELDQRVLLHRARCRVRNRLEEHLSP